MTPREPPASLSSVCNQLHWLERYIQDYSSIEAVRYCWRFDPSAGPHFFETVVMLLLDSSILCVSRLLDNEAKQMTVLRAITDTINDKGQQGDVTEQLKKTRKSYQRIIDDRNIFIAHGNYEAVRDRMSKGPTGAESTISDCRDAARDIRALIEKICDKSGLPRPEQLAEDPKWKGVDQTLKQLCDL